MTVLESLRRDGIAVVPFEELFGDEGDWPRFAADAAGFAAEVEPLVLELLGRDEPKRYIVRRFVRSPLAPGRKRPRLTLSNPILQLGLAPGVLDAVNAYRGESTHLADLDYWYAVPTPGEEPEGARRWHRAPWDANVVQLFVFFSGLDDRTGSFQFLLGSQTGGRYGDLWPTDGGEIAVYPDEDELLAAVDEEDVLTITGPPGTAIVADTSGFHRLGLGEIEPQLLSYYTYISPHSPHATKDLRQSTPGYRFEVDWTDGRDDLRDSARFAIAWSDRPVGANRVS